MSTDIKIDDYEKYLRKNLKDELNNPEMRSDIIEASKDIEYVYKRIPLWNGGLNANGQYEVLHLLTPKEDYDAWDKKFNLDGMPNMGGNSKGLFISTIEVIDREK